MALDSNWQEVEQQTAGFNVQYDHIRNELDKKVDEAKALGEQRLSTTERLEEEKSARLAAEDEARRSKKVSLTLMPNMELMDSSPIGHRILMDFIGTS